MCKKEEVEKLAVIRQREIELGLVKPVKAEELFSDKCKKEIGCIKENKTGGVKTWKS